MNYQYEPIISRLDGTLVNRKINIDIDNNIQIYVLQLNFPINIIQTGKLHEGEYNTTEHNIEEIQLAGVYHDKINQDILYQNIEITGKLFHAHTAHHYTTILIDVDSIIVK